MRQLGARARHPATRSSAASRFPGPGLAIRILGEVTAERVAVLQAADAIVDEEIRAAGSYDRLWQAFAVLLPVKTVGVMGDERTYENVLALRAVESVDGMTADWARLPHELLARCLEPDHQRGARRQPRRLRHLVEAAGDDRVGVMLDEIAGRVRVTTGDRGWPTWTANESGPMANLIDGRRRHDELRSSALHTQYSLARRRQQDPSADPAVKALGMPAVAMTDHGNMFGAVEFYKKAVDAGVQPIIGCEVYVAPESRATSGVGRGDDFEAGGNYPPHPAGDERGGLPNLCRLVTLGYTEGFYYKPRIDKELLRELNGGLIALSGCLASEVNQAIAERQRSSAPAR